jgi:glycoprotein 6-alpha-L-fucosyltransferase
MFERIHVRRTDKVGSEAAFHDISEYMKYVEDYYIIYQYQNPNLKFTKRVYVATDEPTVVRDARMKYEFSLISFCSKALSIKISRLCLLW